MGWKFNKKNVSMIVNIRFLCYDSGMDKRKLFGKKDMLFIVAALVLAVLVWLFTRNDAAPYCVVSYNGEIVKTVSLENDTEFTVAEAPGMGFTVRNGRVAVSHSDCPDKVCVRTGFIKSAGQAAVCLPNKIVLSVENAPQAPDMPDIIAG